MKSCGLQCKQMKVRVTKSYKVAYIAIQMCEIPKIPKIYDYNRDKMGITQNKVIWIKNTGGQISLS